MDIIFVTKNKNNKDYKNTVTLLINVTFITEWLNDNVKEYKNHIIKKSEYKDIDENIISLMPKFKPLLITKEQLIKLKNDLTVIINNKAKYDKMFPNVNSYDKKDYENKLKETLLTIKELINNTNFDTENIYFDIL